MRSIPQALDEVLSRVGQPVGSEPEGGLRLIEVAYGVKAWGATPEEAWGRIPHHHLHTGMDWFSIPPGAMVYFPHLAGGGRVLLSVGDRLALATDDREGGVVSVVSVDLHHLEGHLHYGGWTFWTAAGTARWP